jgi:hypothetical protein
MSAKNKVLLLLHGTTGWVAAKDLCAWVEYSNFSSFKKNILRSLHAERLIEFDSGEEKAQISPLGISRMDAYLVEQNLS